MCSIFKSSGILIHSAAGENRHLRWSVLDLGCNAGFYHLRYPLLALDILHERVERLLVLQTLTMPGTAVLKPPVDFPLDERELLLQPGWPKLAFIEHRLAHDPTNWWAPNHDCVEAMLRASGFSINGHPAHETYLCAPNPKDSEESRWLRQRELTSATGCG